MPHLLTNGWSRFALVFLAAAAARAAEESLGEKIKKILRYAHADSQPPETQHKKQSRHQSDPDEKQSTPEPRRPLPRRKRKSRRRKRRRGFANPEAEEEEITDRPETKERTSPPDPDGDAELRRRDRRSPTPTPDDSSIRVAEREKAVVATISPDEIEGYDENSPEDAASFSTTRSTLTKQDLDYTYGSADPGKRRDGLLRVHLLRPAREWR